jgi:hypothetical protein
MPLGAEACPQVFDGMVATNESVSCAPVSAVPLRKGEILGTIKHVRDIRVEVS